MFGEEGFGSSQFASLHPECTEFALHLHLTPELPKLDMGVAQD